MAKKGSSLHVFPCSFFYSLCFDRAAYSSTTKARISCCICHIRQAQQYAHTRFRCVPGTRNTLLPSYPICLTAASPFSLFVNRNYCITRMANCKKIAVYAVFYIARRGGKGVIAHKAQKNCHIRIRMAVFDVYNATSACCSQDPYQ